METLEHILLFAGHLILLFWTIRYFRGEPEVRIFELTLLYLIVAAIVFILTLIASV